MHDVQKTVIALLYEYYSQEISYVIFISLLVSRFFHVIRPLHRQSVFTRDYVSRNLLYVCF
jgi:hypothetical protein